MCVCGTSLPPEASWDATGTRCEVCGTAVPVVQGVPRFVPSDAYTSSFSFEWNRHRLTQFDTADSHESERTFREKTGLTPDDIKDKLVLDVGCGMGRFADVVSRWGGQVVGIDLSLAVEAAYANLAGRDNVRILQADLFRLPFPPETFDIVYSIGVLHHTPDCEKAFRQLPRLLRPGGKLAIWVYGTMGPWVKFADLYRRFTVRMPPRLLHALCHMSDSDVLRIQIPLVGPLYGLFCQSACTQTPDGGSSIHLIGIPRRHQSKHTYPEVYRWFISEGLGGNRVTGFPGLRAGQETWTVRTMRPGKIKIAFVIGTLDLGGTEHQLVALSQGARSVQVLAYCLLPNGDRGRWSPSWRRPGSRPVLRLCGASKCGETRSKSPDACSLFFADLKKEKPEIVHGLLFHAYVLGAFAARIARIPIVVASRRSLSHFKAGKPHYPLIGEAGQPDDRPRHCREFRSGETGCNLPGEG